MSAVYCQFKREKDNYKNFPVFQEGASVLHSVLWEHKQETKIWGRFLQKRSCLNWVQLLIKKEEKHYRVTEK